MIDGDTLKMGRQRIRLFGIDAPESRQSCQTPQGQDWWCGSEASKAVRSMVSDQIVTCHQQDIDLVLTSCGFGVPLYDFEGQRDVLDSWAAKKGDDGLLTYQREKNAESLDGLPTGLVQDGRHV